MESSYVLVNRMKITVCHDSRWGSNALLLNHAGVSSILDLQELHRLTHLEKLDLQGNKISKIEGLEPLTQLTHLELKENRIREITGLEQLRNLQYLNLGGNRITTIRGLESLRHLTHLDLSGNRIREITGLEHLRNLQYLNLGGNRITTIRGLETLTHLTHLDLSKNRIEVIMGLENLTHLRHLSLGENRISEIGSLETLTHLHSLSLQKNNIETKHGLEHLPGLKELNLDWNPVDMQEYAVFNDSFDAKAAEIARRSDRWSYRGTSKDFYRSCIETDGRCFVRISRMSPSATRKWIKDHPQIPVVKERKFRQQKPPYQLWIVEVEGTGHEKLVLTISPVLKEIVHTLVIQRKPKKFPLDKGAVREFLSSYRKVALEVVAEHFFPLPHHQSYAEFLKRCDKMDGYETRGDFVFKTPDYYRWKTHIQQALQTVEVAVKQLIREEKLRGLIRPVAGKHHFIAAPAQGQRRSPLSLACPSCGIAIRSEWTTCPQCLSPLGGSRSTCFCTHCGEVIQPTWRACPYCSNVVRRV